MNAMRAKLSVGTAVLVVSLACGLARVSTAAAASPPAPAIVSIVAAPASLPAAGGTVRVTVRVRNAATCAFRGQPAPFASYRPAKTASCASGRASMTFTVAANGRATAATIHFVVRAVSAGGLGVQKTVSVREAAGETSTSNVPPPAISTASLPNGTVGVSYSSTLTASGGTPPYAWSVVSGSPPPGTTLSAAGVLSGSPTRSGQALFTVQVTDAAGKSTTQALAVTITPSRVSVTPTSSSSNWSGYALDGGPFTSVTGTFNVPSLTNTIGQVNNSEWVGVDGDSDANPTLIQAGVAQSVSTFGRAEMHAWWEILPAVETPIETVSVRAGDSITVTIAQVGTGLWTISLVNNTTGQSFSTTQVYTGTASSVEWIVEAPTLGTRTATLGSFTPNVTFTNMLWSGSATAFSPIKLTQRGATVSVPSALSPSQTSFSVAYGSTPPAVPS